MGYFDRAATAVRQTLRGLARRPGYAAVAILTLALGIGANTAIFTILDAVLLRPLPFKDPDSLVWLNSTHLESSGKTEDYQSHPLEVLKWKEQSRTLSHVAALRRRSIALSGVGQPENVAGAGVSAEMFEMLGAQPLLGRTFTAAEDVRGSGVAVVSYEYWRRRFGADPSLVGRTLSLDGEPRVVIGVMRPGFRPLMREANVMVPLGLARDSLASSPNRFLDVAGRMRPGVSRAAVQSELRRLARDLERESPATQTGYGLRVTTISAALLGDRRPALLALFAAVGFVLLMACANVANLTLVHVAARRSEAALRLALGASRWQVAQLQVAESVVIAVAGGAAGVALAFAALRPLLALDTEVAALLGPVRIDARVLAFTTGVSVVSGLACAVVPALRGGRVGLSTVLGEGSRRTAGARGDQRVRQWLVASQVALALVLLAGAGLMVRSFERLGRLSPGFDARNVLTMQVTLPDGEYPDKTRRAQYASQALDALRSVPGVVAASTTLNRFRTDGDMHTRVVFEGRPSAPSDEVSVRFRRVSPGYFRTLRIALREGREFDDGDRAEGMPVAVISRALAERYWPHESPIGKRLKRPGARNPYLTVVGVASDVMDVGIGVEMGPTLYIPYAQNNSPFISFVVRTAGDPARLAPALREAIWTVDRDQPVDAIIPLDRLMVDTLAPQRFRTTLLGVFAAVGLVLAAVGIYGVTAYAVVERTREVGVRMALGAAPGAVVRMFLAQSLRWVLLGLAMGVVVARLLAGAIEKLLYGVGVGDGGTFVAVSLILAAVAGVATYLPVRRATAITPVEALRGE